MSTHGGTGSVNADNAVTSGSGLRLVAGTGSAISDGAVTVTGWYTLGTGGAPIRTPAMRMLELTSLVGVHTPAEHFLSIVTGDTIVEGGIVIHEETRVKLADVYEVVLAEDVYTVTLDDDDN